MYFILGVVSLYIILVIRRRYFIYALLNKSDVVYIDEKGSKSFVNAKYGVLAKPDRVSIYKGKKYVIEFKSRKKGIFDKDIVQALVGGLSCYEDGLSPEFVVVYNSSYEYKVVRIKSEKALLKRIGKLISKAQSIKRSRSTSSFFRKGKCVACIYSNSCSKSG